MTRTPRHTTELNRQEDSWSFEGARRHHIRQGLRLTPAERLHWLEETVEEMRRLQGLARHGRKVADLDEQR